MKYRYSTFYCRTLKKHKTIADCRERQRTMEGRTCCPSCQQVSESNGILDLPYELDAPGEFICEMITDGLCEHKTCAHSIPHLLGNVAYEAMACNIPKTCYQSTINTHIVRTKCAIHG